MKLPKPKKGAENAPERAALRPTTKMLPIVITIFFEITNSRLSNIEEKLNMLLLVPPELETYKQRLVQLEEETKSLQTSLENSQTPFVSVINIAN